MSHIDLNGLDYWFPKIEAAGLPVPRTTIIKAAGDLTPLLDGQDPGEWFQEFRAMVQAACYDHGVPCFLRTSHTSGKHNWLSTCYVENAETVHWHIYNLVEASHLADIFGLPHDTWAVRDLIPNAPAFVLNGYEGMPYVPEWRWFVRDGYIEHIQRYWPLDSLEKGRPSIANWREVAERLNSSIENEGAQYDQLGILARDACKAVGGGYWSIDFLWSSVTQSFWLTDMADGDRSFKYEARTLR